MNLQYLNLDLYDIPEDAKTQVTVFLIAAELKTRKLTNSLASIGCETCFCTPDLCDVILAFAGFDDRPNELYEYYFELLDEYCDKVTHENDTPIEEAYAIYNRLRQEKNKLLN
ncbi:hypothetical protein KK083_21405 [Fulvivirgaceae bacterium PWU4]|uniref:Uncharacterized protein n=1 Tax=Chryseosolibacter histidini TaxID=2782349 RepID=A0AAP2DQ18_9BACT|nr:hypothetical protein [Chryseosolibacter histidini]MBT1699469.1 hypothetical protein [Chryseosolibacter histidini]